MVLFSVIALFYIAIIGKTILATMIFALLSSILLLPVTASLLFVLIDSLFLLKEDKKIKTSTT